MKNIILKLTKASLKTGPFDITDQFDNVIDTNVSIYTLIEGTNYDVNDDVSIITLTSIGSCKMSVSMNISTIGKIELTYTPFVEIKTSCIWRHLTNVTINNQFYGQVVPYIIEYPFAYQYQDEILQNVKDYTKVYLYSPDGTGVYSYTDKIMVDNIWFNKAILYNGQQCTGVLELVPKPKNNLQAYNAYPIYKADSKIITYTKSDSFYQYNTFWDVLKNKAIPIAVTSCDSLSVDGIVNQDNMDYSTRSFKKAPMRAKELKIRHILDNRSDVHMVSQFIITPSQISYK